MDLFCIFMACQFQITVCLGFQNSYGGPLGFRGQDGANSKNIHFIGFAIPKIVQLDIYHMFIARIVPELSNLLLFKMAMTFLLKNSHFKNFPLIFERGIGAIFCSKWFQCTN